MKAELLSQLMSSEIIGGMKYECIGEVKFPVYKDCDCHFDNLGSIPEHSCGLCNGEGHYYDNVTVPWGTMKDIYKMMHDCKVRILTDV